MVNLNVKQKELVAFLILIIVGVLFVFVLPSLIGFVARGFDTQAIINQYVIYGNFAVAGIFFLILAFVLESTISKGDSKYGDGILFHSPGEKPANKFFRKFNGLQLLHISVIFFGILGLIASSVRQTSFTGIQFLEQQFTETASLLFSTVLIPMAENLFFIGILAIILSGLRIWARKNNWTSQNFNGISLGILVILGGLIQLGYHSLRYAGSDIALITVFVFWGLGALITYVTGSFIPFWIMHVMNNLIFDLKRFFSSDAILFTIGGFILLLIVIYPLIWKGRLLGSSRNTSIV